MMIEEEKADHAQHGLAISRAVFERDGNALLVAAASFISAEELPISEAALLVLLAATRPSSARPN